MLNNRLMIMKEENNKSPYNRKKMVIIQGRYRVVKISDNLVTLNYFFLKSPKVYLHITPDCFLIIHNKSSNKSLS
jgi:hypothetical protein